MRKFLNNVFCGAMCSLLITGCNDTGGNSSPAKTPESTGRIVYETNRYILYEKTNDETATIEPQHDVTYGAHITQAQAQENINAYQKAHTGTGDTTRYVKFSCDSLLNYIGYLGSKLNHVKTDSLALLAYFAKDISTNRNTIVFIPSDFHAWIKKTRPIPGNNKSLKVEDEEISYFDRGLICPNCPNDAQNQ
jgi:hypothetical protein